MQDFTLEKHRFFPYVAWTLVIGFAVFTYSLAQNLADTENTLSQKTQSTLSALDES